jgi:hypothetical protein
MKPATTIENRVDELLAILETDMRDLKEGLSRLNELRGLVIKRDDAALSRLLDTIRAEANSRSVQGAKRQSIRRDLAKELLCSAEQVTLSRMESILPETKRSRIASTKAALRVLVKELQEEHTRTAMLLSECARLNRLFLRHFLGLGKTETATYSPDGVRKRQNDTAFVSIQF